jgi:cell division protein FtsW
MRIASTILVLCVGGLLAVGMVMLYSSSMVQQGAHYLLLQLVWGAFGIVTCVVATFFDYRKFKKFACPLFIVALALLGLVLVPGIGMHINGSRRWLNLRFGSFQPSEAAKFGLIVILAWYGERYHLQMRKFVRGLVLPGLLILPVLGLIIKEPDLGTTLLLATISGILLLLSGTRWHHLVVGGVIVLGALFLFLRSSEVRWKRVETWLHPEENRSGNGYQAWQAQIALGAGGTTGLGLGNGRQKLGFVPENHTDFIYSIIGEELGLVATMGILVAFALFICAGGFIAWKACDVFGFLLAVGITFLIGLQAFINIGVVTSALPNKGLPCLLSAMGDRASFSCSVARVCC